MARNFHIPPLQGGLPLRPDLDGLLAPPAGEPQLRRWSIRIAEEVACEVGAIAGLKSLSVNALVMVALDRVLTDAPGRRGAREGAADARRI
jgi:hypothetical protein